MNEVRTVLVFLDLPIHYEFVASPMPLMSVGDEIEFDLIINDPNDTKRKKIIEGPYLISLRKLKYDSRNPSKLGLTQYLELTPKQWVENCKRPLSVVK